MQRISLVEYDLRWPDQFEKEAASIQRAMGSRASRIEHVGSTSVPGLTAKPVIDIQISVEQLHPIAAYAPCLAQLGYEHLPHADDAFCPFFHRPSDWPHTHHVHVVQAGGDEERRILAFRDYLREHSSLASQYEDLKLRLAPHYSAAEFSSRQAYVDAKGEFVNRITQLALARGYPRDL